MVKGLIFIGLLLMSLTSYAQSNKKLTKEESAKMTPDQRFVHETDRKSNHGKKNVSVKKKAKISKKQDRRSRRTKETK